MSRRFQVLPFTLSELFVLLFFILALAMANEVHKRAEVEREQAEVEAAMGTLTVEAVRSVAAIFEDQDSIPDDFQELVRRVAEQEQSRPAIERVLREAGRDSARMADASTRELIRDLSDLNEEMAARNEELAARNEELADRSDRLAELAGLTDDESGTSPGERLLAATEQLERDNRDLRSQLANLVRRTGGGMDHPPCWADPQGRIEYAFEAAIHTSHVDLRPVWPRHRDRDARDIPGMTTAAGEGLSYAEFSRRALPILRWSRQQEPSCRHFVRILDRVDGGKDAFKEGLLTVEHYFYKLLVD